MIEKILGVVCLLGAGLIYTVERIASHSASVAAFEDVNGYVVALTILAALFLLAASGRRVWGCIKWLGTDNDWEDQRLADYVNRASDS